MFPRWLSWLVLGMMVYLLVQSRSMHAPALPTPQVAPTTVVKEGLPNPSGSVSKAADIERWKKAINPEYAAKAQCSLPAPSADKLWWRVTEEKTGTGAGAQCTEAITVKVTVWNSKGESRYTGEASLNLGAGEIAAGLDAALMGMRVGASRTVLLAPGTYTRAKDAPPLPKFLSESLHRAQVTVLTIERVK